MFLSSEPQMGIEPPIFFYLQWDAVTIELPGLRGKEEATMSSGSYAR